MLRGAAAEAVKRTILISVHRYMLCANICRFDQCYSFSSSVLWTPFSAKARDAVNSLSAQQAALLLWQLEAGRK